MMSLMANRRNRIFLQIGKRWFSVVLLAFWVGLPFYQRASASTSILLVGPDSSQFVKEVNRSSWGTQLDSIDPSLSLRNMKAAFHSFYPSFHIKTLEGSEATRYRILDEIVNQLKSMGRDDTFFIYFNTHGFLWNPPGDQKPDTLLVTADTSIASGNHSGPTPESMFGVIGRKDLVDLLDGKGSFVGQAIQDQRQLEDFRLKLPHIKRFIFLDACYAHPSTPTQGILEFVRDASRYCYGVNWGSARFVEKQGSAWSIAVRRYVDHLVGRKRIKGLLQSVARVNLESFITNLNDDQVRCGKSGPCNIPRFQDVPVAEDVRRIYDDITVFNNIRTPQAWVDISGLGKSDIQPKFVLTENGNEKTYNYVEASNRMRKPFTSTMGLKIILQNLKLNPGEALKDDTGHLYRRISQADPIPVYTGKIEPKFPIKEETFGNDLKKVADGTKEKEPPKKKPTKKERPKKNLTKREPLKKDPRKGEIPPLRNELKFARVSYDMAQPECPESFGEHIALLKGNKNLYVYDQDRGSVIHRFPFLAETKAIMMAGENLPGIIFIQGKEIEITDYCGNKLWRFDEKGDIDSKTVSYDYDLESRELRLLYVVGTTLRYARLKNEGNRHIRRSSLGLVRIDDYLRGNTIFINKHLVAVPEFDGNRPVISIFDIRKRERTVQQPLDAGYKIFKLLHERSSNRGVLVVCLYGAGGKFRLYYFKDSDLSKPVLVNFNDEGMVKSNPIWFQSANKGEGIFTLGVVLYGNNQMFFTGIPFNVYDEQTLPSQEFIRGQLEMPISTQKVDARRIFDDSGNTKTFFITGGKDIRVYSSFVDPYMVRLFAQIDNSFPLPDGFTVPSGIQMYSNSRGLHCTIPVERDGAEIKHFQLTVRGPGGFDASVEIKPITLNSGAAFRRMVSATDLGFILEAGKGNRVIVSFDDLIDRKRPQSPGDAKYWLCVSHNSQAAFLDLQQKHIQIEGSGSRFNLNVNILPASNDNSNLHFKDTVAFSKDGKRFYAIDSEGRVYGFQMAGAVSGDSGHPGFWKAEVSRDFRYEPGTNARKIAVIDAEYGQYNVYVPCSDRRVVRFDDMIEPAPGAIDEFDVVNDLRKTWPVQDRGELLKKLEVFYDRCLALTDRGLLYDVTDSESAQSPLLSNVRQIAASEKLLALLKKDGKVEIYDRNPGTNQLPLWYGHIDPDDEMDLTIVKNRIVAFKYERQMIKEMLWAEVLSQP